MATEGFGRGGRKVVFGPTDKDALRAISSEEFKARPKSHFEEFRSSRGHEKEIARILDSARKFKPYQKRD